MMESRETFLFRHSHVVDTTIDGPAVNFSFQFQPFKSIPFCIVKLSVNEVRCLDASVAPPVAPDIQGGILLNTVPNWVVAPTAIVTAFGAGTLQQGIHIACNKYNDWVGRVFYPASGAIQYIFRYWNLPTNTPSLSISMVTTVTIESFP